MHDSVMAALKARLADADRVDVSRYQFINIEAVKTASGSLWPSLRQRVFVATRSIIERRVADDDLIIPCASGFLVIFKMLSGEAASKLTDKIHEEMERFFLGARELVELKVQSASQSLSMEEFQVALNDVEILDEPIEETSLAAPIEPVEERLRLSSLAYHSVWDSEREAVASYFVRPKTNLETADGWVPDLDAQLAKPDYRLSFDLDVLTEAASALGILLASGTRCALIIPAGYASLAHARQRSAYVTALAALPREMRPLIWLRLEGAAVDAPSATLSETGRIIRGRTQQLFVHTDRDALSLDRLADLGASWIGASAAPTQSQAVFADMERFMALAKRAGAQVYFDECHDWAAARAASRVGARLLAGKAVGVLDEPTAPFRLTRAALLAKAA